MLTHTHTHTYLGRQTSPSTLVKSFRLNVKKDVLTISISQVSVSCCALYRKKEENERLGYERWLVQRQQEKADRLSRTVTATSRSRHDYTERDDEIEDGDPKSIGALRSYLRSLGRSKAGVPYEKWLNDKEREVSSLPVGKMKLLRA